MSAVARSLSPLGNPPQAPRPPPNYSAQGGLGRVQYTPPRPDPMTNIPGFANLPALDGGAAFAALVPANAVVGPSSSAVGPSRVPAGAGAGAPARRRNTFTNPRPAGTTLQGATPLVAQFGNFNLGVTPPRGGGGGRNVNRSAGAGAAANPPQQQQQQQQWPIPPRRTAADIARAAQVRNLARILTRTKQATTDCFRAWRSSPGHWKHWNRSDTRPRWTAIPIPPKSGIWPRHPPIQPGEALSAVDLYGVPGAPAAAARGPGGVRRVFDRVRRRMAGRDGVGLMGRFRGGGGGGATAAAAAAVDLGAPNTRLLNRLNARLAADFEPAGIRYKRRLGQGGYGAVFLFEMVAERGVSHSVVVKASTREMLINADPFEDELANLNLMNGSSHFLQRLFLQDLPLPAASRRRRIRMATRSGLAAVREVFRQTSEVANGYASLSSNGSASSGRRVSTWFSRRQGSRQTPRPGDADRVPGYTTEELDALRLWRFHLDNTRDIIVLENMPRGDVKDLIVKLVEKNMNLSNRALWTIFECLFKACVGMATPGRFHEAGLDANDHAMTEQDETVPGWLHDGTRWPPRPLVHFDLDPQNAMVGNFGDVGGPHENVPIIKVGDPGLAVVVNDNVRNDEAKLWNLRLRGKAHYFHPEQFTPEWEYKAAIDIANLSQEATAGNYNWWSNLYQVGWIMWSLVTHCVPPLPPRAWPYTYESEAPGVVGNVSGFTYGMHVMTKDCDYCDEELKRQILRCLDHDPTKRPKMGWFEAVCTFNVVRPDLVQAESDEQLKAHMNSIYGDPV